MVIRGKIVPPEDGAPVVWLKRGINLPVNAARCLVSRLCEWRPSDLLPQIAGLVESSIEDSAEIFG